MGKPKLTESLISDVCKVISIGGSMKIALHYVGVSEPAFYKWIRIGEEELERLASDSSARPDPNKRLAVKLVQRIRETRANAAVGWLMTIDRAAQDDPRWADRMLRCWYPEYRESQQIDITSGGERIGALPSVGELQEAMEIVKRAIASTSSGDASDGS